MANLTIFYQNVRGLRSKTNVFYRNILSCDSDIICLSETWLLPGIYDSELFDERFVVYRCDRDYTSRNDCMGGGVLIAVRRGIVVSSFDVLPSNGEHSGDIISICISSQKNHNKGTSHIYCVYFPHSTSQFDDEVKFFESVSKNTIFYPDDNFIIVGDFNISNATWTSFNKEQVLCVNDTNSNSLVLALSMFLCFNDFKQFNTIANYNMRYLDLVMSNCECIVNKSMFPLVKEDHHHPSLEILVVDIYSKALRSSPRVVRLFNRADYTAIDHALSEINWDTCFENKNIESSVSTFYDILNKVIADYVPMRFLRTDSNYPVWYTSSLIKVVREKLKYHKRWKCYRRQVDYRSFSILRERQKNLEVSCYNAFIDNTEKNILRCSKHFWKFVKSKKRVDDLPEHLYFNDTSSSDGSIVCDLFNEHFKSSFQSINVTTTVPLSDNNSGADISSLFINKDTVTKYLKSLNIGKGAGPDGIPPFFLRHCYKSLSHPLFILFNISLSSGIMPKIWKKSFVVPVFKSGDKHNVVNYRPISI